jgi:leucyl aminopeptidase
MKEFKKGEKEIILEYFNKENELIKDRNSITGKIKKASDANKETEVKILTVKLEDINNRIKELSKNYEKFSQKIDSVKGKTNNDNTLKIKILELHIQLLKKRINKYQGYINRINEYRIWIKEYRNNEEIKKLFGEIQELKGEGHINYIEFSNEEIKEALENAFN